jgi:hypothetical protein
MSSKVKLDSIYVPSDDVVAREIEGELIIVPLSAGIGDMEDELYTMNETGRAVWNALDGKKTLRVLVDELGAKFKAAPDEIEQDVLGLVGELLKRKMVAEKPCE